MQEVLQQRIHRLEERNRNMIAERARGGYSQQNSPFGTPRGSFGHGGMSPFAMGAMGSIGGESHDLAMQKAENMALQNEVHVHGALHQGQHSPHHALLQHMHLAAS